MTALVGLLPERKAGMVIFANLDHAELRHALMYRVFDQVTGAPARDWSAEFLTLYADSLYGKASVRVEDNRLVLVMSDLLTADLEHWHHDTFRPVYRNRWIGGGLMTFRLDAEGRVAILDLGGGRMLQRSR